MPIASPARIERASDGPWPPGLSFSLRGQMGMTRVEPAYCGLKDRCNAVLLHTRMSHTGLEPVSED